MPRKPIDPSDPDKLQYYVPVMFSRRDLDAIERLSRRYGMSNGAAVRILMRSAPRYQPDPFTPTHTDKDEDKS